MTASNGEQHIPIEDLAAYADGEIWEPAERDRIKQHLALCDQCRQELLELRAVSQLLAELPEPQTPRSFRLTPADVAPAADSEPELIQPWILRHQALFRYAGLAAALLLVVVVTIDLLPGDANDTEDLFTVQESIDEAAPETDGPVDEPGVMRVDDEDAAEEPDAEVDPDDPVAEEDSPEESPADALIPDSAEDEVEDSATEPEPGDDVQSFAQTEPEPREPGVEPTEVEEPDPGPSTLQLIAIILGFFSAVFLLAGFVLPRWRRFTASQSSTR